MAPTFDSAYKPILLALGIYWFGFFAFLPPAIANTDEASYLTQARLILHQATDAKLDPITGSEVSSRLSRHPLGTALLMAPFVWAFGFPGAFLGSLLCLTATVLVTARWLEKEGRSPIFSLLILGYPSALVLGRMALSDLPSMAIVSLGLWTYWRGQNGPKSNWLASGFFAGASIAFRETNILPFAGFFLESILRREKRSWLLVLGFFPGLGVRLLAHAMIYGNALHFRNPVGGSGSFVTGPLSLDGYWALSEQLISRLWSSAPLTLISLLIFIPGGILAALLYRGPRWRGLIASTLLFVGLYMLYGVESTGGGTVKRLVLGPRFFLPLVPLLVFAMAEVVPRVWQQITGLELGRRGNTLDGVARALVLPWILLICGACFLVHPVFYRWSAEQAGIHDAIAQQIGVDDVVVTNWNGTSKFLLMRGLRYRAVDRPEFDPQTAEMLVGRHGRFKVVLLDRSDSGYWETEALQNEALLQRLGNAKALEFDRRFTATDRLRIWRVGEPRAVATADDARGRPGFVRAGSITGSRR